MARVASHVCAHERPNADMLPVAFVARPACGTRTRSQGDDVQPMGGTVYSEWAGCAVYRLRPGLDRLHDENSAAVVFGCVYGIQGGRHGPSDRGVSR